jgi:beta-galactosidase
MNRRELLRSLAAAGIGAKLLPALSLRAQASSSAWPYLCGVAYYPEQRTAAQLPEDFRKMQDLGINLVRMGEFAWSSMQPTPTTFKWDWLDRAVELAAQHKVKVAMGTPTAMMPPWLVKAYPDTLGGNEQGPYTYGGRKGFEVDSPAMRSAAGIIISRLAERYGKHPNVIAWQLGNEPGHPPHNFNPTSLRAFRKWLQQRYGTLDKLNAAWSGTFWSNTYDSWDEIVFPTNSAEGGWNPGVHLDYNLFFSDSFIRWLRFENDLVRKHAPGKLVFVNWPEVAWSVDLFKTAEFLDASAWDNYGDMAGDADPHAVLSVSMNHDLCRCTKADQRFLIAEQPTQPKADTDARAIRLTTWTDVAHGAFGTLYFEWSPPLLGSEMAYTSMLEPDDSLGGSAPLVKQTLAEIQRLWPQLAEARTIADLALIYSYDNSYDQGFRQHSGPLAGRAYDNVASRYYTGMKSLRRNVDVIPVDRDLSPYKLIAAPGLRLVSEEQASNLAQWVQSGGILLVDIKAGTRTPVGNLRPLLTPGLFATIAGITIQSTEGMRQKSTLMVALDRKDYAVSDAEHVILHGAQPLTAYQGTGLQGLPAITINPSGKGFVVYVSFTSEETGFFDALFTALAKRFAIKPLLDAPIGVDVVSRTHNGTEYLFAINNTRDTVHIPLPSPAKELLSSTTVSGKLEIKPLDLAIVQMHQKE